MALRTHDRDSFVLSTKVGYFLRPDTTPSVLGVHNEAMSATMPFTMEFDYG